MPPSEPHTFVQHAADPRPPGSGGCWYVDPETERRCALPVAAHVAPVPSEPLPPTAGWARVRKFFRVLEYKMLVQGVLVGLLAPFLPLVFVVSAVLNAWDVSAFPPGYGEGDDDAD